MHRYLTSQLAIYLYFKSLGDIQLAALCTDSYLDTNSQHPETFHSVLAVSVAQLSPSGDVQVCLGAVVEVTCNISRSFSILSWEVVPPLRSNPVASFTDTNSLPEIGVPVPHSLSGINLTIHNVTDTSIVSNLTVNTSNFNITDDPIGVRCTGADGEAAIRNFGQLCADNFQCDIATPLMAGVPGVEALLCTHRETGSSDFSQVTLSWSLNDGSAPVDNYTLFLTPSPPSLTPLLIIITTTTTTATLTLLTNITYTVQITADSCVGSTTTNHSIEQVSVQKLLKRERAAISYTDIADVCGDFAAVTTTTTTTTTEDMNIAPQGMYQLVDTQCHFMNSSRIQAIPRISGLCRQCSGVSGWCHSQYCCLYCYGCVCFKKETRQVTILPCQVIPGVCSYRGTNPPS